MTSSNEQAAVRNPSSDQILATVDALSQLLALNSCIEQARADISQPFHVSANRVMERAHPESGVRIQRGQARPSVLAVAMNHASALLRPALDGPVAANATPNLSEQAS